MITALVQFKLPQPVSRDKAREIFLRSAPKYRAGADLDNQSNEIVSDS